MAFVEAGDSFLYRLGEYSDTMGVTIADSTISISAAVPDGCTDAIVQIETGDVRMRVDGVAPTTSSGFVLLKSEPFYILDYDTLKNAVFIRSGSTTAYMNFLFRRRE